MFNKKKKESTAPAPVENTSTEVQFEKNIKTLWVYTTLFCLFALALIAVSSVIQGKINSKAEYYQEQYENAQTSSQSTIKNIQDENAALKKDLEAYKSKAETLEKLAETDKELINEASELVENADYLMQSWQYLTNGKKDSARTELKKVNFEILSETMREVYEMLTERLD